MKSILHNARARHLGILLFASLLLVAPSHAQEVDSPSTQTTDQVVDPSAPDAALPVDPPKKQNQLQATSLTGSPAGAGGDNGLPGVAERVPGMVVRPT